MEKLHFFSCHVYFDVLTDFVHLLSKWKSFRKEYENES